LVFNRESRPGWLTEEIDIILLLDPSISGFEHPVITKPMAAIPKTVAVQFVT